MYTLWTAVDIYTLLLSSCVFVCVGGYSCFLDKAKAKGAFSIPTCLTHDNVSMVLIINFFIFMF